MRKKFQTFNDGICLIHEIDDDGNAGAIVERLRFQKRTVGIKRYYEAITAKIQVDELIRVHYRPWLTTGYLISIADEIYKIVQVQDIFDSLPKTNDVTLKYIKQRI